LQNISDNADHAVEFGLRTGPRRHHLVEAG